MRTATLTSLILTLLFIGCTHRHAVRPAKPDDYAALNRLAFRKQAVVSLKHGRKVPAEKLHFAPDSTSWVDPMTQQVVTSLTADISDIRFVHRGKGALEGLGLGLLGGAVSGALIGFADGDDPDGFLAFTAEQKAIFVGTAFGIIGGLVGLPVGAIIGSKDIYHYQDQHSRAATLK